MDHATVDASRARLTRRLSFAQARLRLSRLSVAGLAVAVSALCPASAFAQSSVLIGRVYDPDYNKGRNQSVTERPRPDYDPLGIRIGGFIANLNATVQAGFTDNVFTDNLNKISDGFAAISTTATVASDWSNHSVRLTGSANLRRYAKQTLQNQNPYFVVANGRLDVTRSLKVYLDGEYDEAAESPFSEDLIANLVVPSRYLRTLAAARATYDRGLSRITVKADRSSYAFRDLEFANGTVRLQRERDRVIYRATAVYEFALSPSLSVYGQVIGDQQSYSTNLPNGTPNRDSTGFNIIAGTNFDLAGLARGSIGIGYSRRNFDASSIYPPAAGISVQALAEIFVSELTTARISLQRQLQDTSLGDGAALWDSRVGVAVDHELLRNLILTATAEYGSRAYQQFDFNTKLFNFSASGRYRLTRTIGFIGSASYGSSKPNGPRLGNPIDQIIVQGGLSVIL